MSDNQTQGMLKRTADALKTYGFSEKHNPREPAQFWFQESLDGLTLFIVFYTQGCRWAKCLGCNLPSRVSANPVHFRHLKKQVDYVFEILLSREDKLRIRKFIISNNGSVLDQVTFSTTVLMYFLAMMNIHCPNVSVLTLETRPEYIDMAELEVLSRALKEGETQTDLELAIGFEAFDEKIRNDHFQKGLELRVFEEMAEKVAMYGFRLKVYFMLKPVPMLSEEDAIADVVRGFEYFDKIARQYGLCINVHLNPTYVAFGTPLEEAFRTGDFTPPQLESVRRAVLHANGKNITVYVGLMDEGLAVPGGSFIREGDEKLIAALNRFNQTQDFNILEP